MFGNHVNTTDSAVRITHIPTKILFVKMKESFKNKNETCSQMPKKLSRFFFIELQKNERNKKIQQKTDIGWGRKIRSYVLQPYQFVKDLRNKDENTNPEDILNGDID